MHTIKADQLREKITDLRNAGIPIDTLVNRKLLALNMFAIDKSNYRAWQDKSKVSKLPRDLREFFKMHLTKVSIIEPADDMLEVVKLDEIAKDLSEHELKIMLMHKGTWFSLKGTMYKIMSEDKVLLVKNIPEYLGLDKPVQI